MNNLFNYIDRPSPIHRLTGATKFVCLLLWSFAAMSTYDTRFLAIIVVVGFLMFRLSNIRISDVSYVVGFTMGVLVLNTIMIYVFAPHHGTEIYGTCSYLTSMRGAYSLTAEQLYYMLNYALKYLALLPIVLIFVCTTNPSEFAASLNKLGVKYSVAYAVALALRYIPDVQRRYHDISQASQARGIEMSKGKTGIINRLKSACSILIPLILTSVDKVEVVANAMELRGFGKNRRRTWYMARPFMVADWLSIAGCILLVVISFLLRIVDGGRFYNPFI